MEQDRSSHDPFDEPFEPDATAGAERPSDAPAPETSESQAEIEQDAASIAPATERASGAGSASEGSGPTPDATCHDTQSNLEYEADPAGEPATGAANKAELESAAGSETEPEDEAETGGDAKAEAAADGGEEADSEHEPEQAASPALGETVMYNPQELADVAEAAVDAAEAAASAAAAAAALDSLSRLTTENVVETEGYSPADELRMRELELERAQARARELNRNRAANPAAEAAEEPEHEPEPAQAPAASSEPEPEPASEPESAPEAEPETAAAAPASEPEPAADTAAAAADEREDDRDSAAEPEPSPAGAAAAASASEPEPEPDAIPERPADLPLTQALPNFNSAQAVDDTVAVGAPSTAREWTGPVEPERQRAKKRSRRLTVVAVIVIILVVVGCFAYFGDWAGGGAESAITGSSTSMCSVTVSVDISGLDTQTGSKIPIKVEGTDANGDSVSQVQYIDETGAGLNLMSGTYTLTVAASPIAGDGTIYTVPDTTLEVTIESDGQDLSSAGTLTFTAPSAETVTDTQISNAYEYAAEGGCTSEALAQILKDAATDRRDAAVSASEARSSEVLEEADDRHKATPTYSFDIPEEWYGKVDTRQNENTVTIYLVDNPDITLVTLTLETDGYDEGTAEYGVLGAVSLGDGTSVVVEGPVWPWYLSQTLNGQTDETSTAYSSSEVELLVELSTGCPYTTSQVRNLVDNGATADGLSQMVEEYLAEVLLPSIEAA